MLEKKCFLSFSNSF